MDDRRQIIGHELDQGAQQRRHRFLGLLERIFQIPGLGGLMVEAIFTNDPPVLMGLTYILAILYCVLQLLSDVLYTIVNPQVALK